VQYTSWVEEDMEINVINDNAVVNAKEVLKILVYEQKVNIVRNIIARFQLQDDKWLLSKIEERKNVI
jgi:hypothetical protein